MFEMVLFETESGVLSMVQLVCIFLLSLGLSVANAEKGSQDTGPAGFHLSKELGLSDEQSKQVKQIKAKYADDLDQSRKNAKSAKEDLMNSMKAPKKGPEYQKELLQKFKKVQEFRQAQHARRFEMALEIRELLTNEQLSKFQAGPHRDHANQ